MRLLLSGHGIGHWLQDLSSQDFYTSGYMRNMVYDCKVNRRGELLYQIFNAARCMNDPDIPCNVTHSMVKSASKLKVCTKFCLENLTGKDHL
jgi:hypothetical protein